MQTRRFAVAAVVIVLLAGVWASLRTVVRGGQAPDVTFMTVKGERIALSALRGHPVLVTFWASDCVSCLKEMPHLIELHRDYAGRGLRIISVAMRHDLPSRVMALTHEAGLPYPVAFDVEGSYARAFDDVALTPDSYLITPSGEIALHTLGLLDMPAFKAIVETMLPEA